MKKYMKRLLAALVAGTAAITLTACGGAADNADNPPSNDDPVQQESNESIEIGVMLKTMNSDYWKCMIAGLNAASADLGVKVSINGPTSETAYDEQINGIETMLGTEIDALVLAPLQPESAAQLVSKAQIPVLAVDTTFPAENLASYVGVSNHDAAKAGGEYVADHIKEQGKVIILAGVQGDTTSEDRIAGFTEGLEGKGCEILSVQYTDAATDRAVGVIEGLLSTYPDGIDAVVCHSDDVAMGAVKALQNAGIKDKVLVCGFGGISGAKALESGVLDASININPYQMGYDAVKTAIDVIEDKPVEDFIPTTPEILDSENIADFMVKYNEWMK